jgi:predicted permease
MMLATDLLRSYAREWGDVLGAPAFNRGKGEGMPWTDRIAQNLRFAIRSFVRSPTFSWAAVLLIALGVGAVTSVFAVVDQVLFRPLPYPEQQRMLYLTNGSHNGPTVRGLDDIAAFDGWTAGYAQDANMLRENGEPTRVRSVVVTPSFFTVFGARPLVGRVLDEGDYADLSVAVVTHAAWETMWGSDPELIGSTITVDSEPVTVVGVLPDDFTLPERMVGRDAQLFRPIDWGDPDHLNPGTRVFRAVVRLAPGVELSVAQAQVDGLADDLMQASLLTFTRETPSWPLVPLGDFTARSARGGLLLLLASVNLLLVIACANVALLFMTRGMARTKEMSVRRALGAGRRTLAGQLITESVVMGATAGVLAAALASITLAGFARWIGDLPRGAAITLDLRIFAFALVLAVATAVAFGLLPALLASRGNVGSRLHQSSRSSTESRVLRWVRSGLVIGEVATSLILLSLAGLLVRSFVELSAQDPGVRPDQVWMIPVRPAASQDPVDYRARMDRILEALSAVPGVGSASYGNEMPLQFVGGNDCCHFSGIVRVEGSEENILEDGRGLPLHYVTASFFETLGVGLVAGSVWDPAQVTTDEPSAIVSEQLAVEAYGSTGAAVGRVLQHRGREFQTVRISGVAQPTLHYGLDGIHDVALYLPVEIHENPEITTFALKLSGSSDAAFSASVREAIWSVEPSLPIPSIEPLTAWIDDSLGTRQLASNLAAAFSVVALILAAAGLYSTLLYAVSQRRRELGIRMALGAGSSRLQADVVLWGLRLGIAGVCIGVPSALYLGRFLRSWLWGVSPTDPMTLVIGCAVLLSATAVASWMPSYRAARTDPLEVLRAD